MGFIKVRKRKYKGSMGDAGGVCQQREHAFLFQVLIKPTLILGRADPGDSHLTMSKQGGVCAVTRQLQLV
jgi:hypothetical protein